MMKRMKKRLALALAVSIAAFSAFGCSSGGTSGGAQSKGSSESAAGDTSSTGAAIANKDTSDQTYILCTYNSTEYFQRQIWAAFQQAGEMLGVKTELVGDTGEDVMKYLTKLDSATAMDPEGIAVMCLDGNAYVDGINKAMDAGIPVVTIAPDSPDSKRISFLGVDNKEIGKFGASIVGEAIDGEGEVLILTKLGMPDCEYMIEGFEEYSAEHYPNLKTVVVPASLDLTDQTAKAASALSANPNINAAYCPLGWQAVAVYQACEELGMEEPIPILGADCELAQLELIKEGKLLGTVRQGTSTQGFWACLSLYLLQNGYISEEHFPETIYSGFDLIDQSNVQEEIDFYNEFNKDQQ